MEFTSRILFYFGICLVSFHFTRGAARDVNGIRAKKINLHHELLSNYGPTSIRPITHNSSSVKVNVRMLVDHIADFDEPKQQLTLFCAIKMIWMDEFLAWNESEYPGISTLEMNIDHIWSPTVTFLTSNSPDFLTMNHRLVEVSSDGQVTWLSPAIITSTCYFDVQLFPFDVQECSFEFGPWASPHDIEDIDYFFERNETTVHRYRDNGVWEIVNDTVDKVYKQYSSHDEPFAEIHYKIIFRRMSRVYVLGIVIPSVLLSLSTMLIFLLPPESGEKISFGITNLLAMVLFQETVRSAMPPTGSPILANYICVMVVVACTTLIVEAVALRMYNLGNAKIPNFVRRLFIRGSHMASCSQSKTSNLHFSEPNGSVIIYSEGKEVTEQLSTEDEQKQQISDSEDAQENGELWKKVALSFEKKVGVIIFCAIIGNIVITSLQIVVLSMMQEKY